MHALGWNWAYVGAVERLGGIEVPRRAEFIRVITCELNRIASHLLGGGPSAGPGRFTPIMYAFEDRERILDILQSVSRSRLTYSFYRPGGVAFDLTDDFLAEVRSFIPHLRKRLPMYRVLVTDNIIFRHRCEKVGELPLEMCRRYAATGPVLRGWDWRTMCAGLNPTVSIRSGIRDTERGDV